MREIKFRAFVENNGIEKIMEVVEMGFDNKCILVCNDSGETFLNNKYKLMQYTGLKDKNGNEIYEGDIVKYMNFIDDIYNEEIGLCKFEQDECNFCIQRIVINNENYPVPTTIRTIYLISNLTYSDDVSYEVIGNIYENPELLEGEEC